jgi:hypothetical protein
MINWPQFGGRLKYFMRLVAIGVAYRGIPQRTKALLAKSQFVEVEGLTAFGPRFLDESLKLRARSLVVDDFFTTLVALCKLTQLIKHGASLCLTKPRQFLDDFTCAQTEIIASVGNLSVDLLRPLIKAGLVKRVGTRNSGDIS